MLSLLLALGPEHAHGTGLEWMPVASVLLSIVALVAIIWLGSRNTV